MGIMRFGGLNGAIGRLGAGIKSGLEKVGRFIKPTLSVANKIAGGLSMLPGTIGTVSKLASHGISAAQKIIDQIPDERVKNTLSGYANQGQDVIKTVSGRATNAAEGIQAKIKPWLKFANDNFG